MKFKDFLISKRNAIITLMCINCFALGINMLAIKGQIKDSSCPDFVYHNLLCSGSYKNEALSQKNFWPFVSYFEFSESSYYCEAGSKKEFKGIFRYFDFSEFLVYTLIILLVFYFKWDSLRKSK
jgi:hypothetical protein